MKYLLLIQNSRFDQSQVDCISILARLLSNSGNEVTISWSSENLKLIRNNPRLEEVSFTDGDSSLDTLVTVETTTLNLAQVQWQETSDKVRIVLSPKSESGNFESNKVIVSSQTKYDKQIIFKPNPKCSHAEVVWQLINQNQLQITDKEATELIAILYDETKLFTRKTTVNTFEVAKKLVELGAQIPALQTQDQSQDLTYAGIQAQQEIYSQLKFTSSKLVFTQLSRKSANALGYTKIQTVIDQLTQLQDAKAVFILIPKGRYVTEVVANSKSLNLKEIFTGYYFYDNTPQTVFEINAGIDSAEQVVRSLMQLGNQ